MGRSLSLSMRRVAAVAILLALVTGIAMSVAIPMRSAHEVLDRSIADLELRMLRYASLAEERPMLEAQRAHLESRLPDDKDLVGGGGDALAGAALQERATDIISQAGGLVERVQILPSVAEGTLMGVSLRLQFSGTVTALQRSLHALESGQPLLFVDAVDVRARAGEVKKVRDDPSLNVILQVVLDIHGYRREARL